MLRSTEGPLGINHPVVTIELAKERAKSFVLCQRPQRPGEDQFSFLESLLQSVDELAAEHAAEHLHGQEEGGARRMNPVLMVGRHAAGGNDAVDVWMVQEILAPGVEDAEEADLSAEVLGIGGDLQQGGGAGAEQQTIDNLLVMKRQRRQFVRKREDHMRVEDIKQLLAAGSEPFFARVGLAFRAMAIATRVERDGLMATAITMVPVSAQGSGAAALDGA